ncbi:hypothetical protein GmRootA79_38390 [Acidovorax sp. A79]
MPFRRSLVEFGLSRITASAIAGLITDSSLPPDKVKAWIRAQPEEMLSKLPSLILAELRAKDLLRSDSVGEVVLSVQEARFLADSGRSE